MFIMDTIVDLSKHQFTPSLNSSVPCTCFCWNPALTIPGSESLLALISAIFWDCWNGIRLSQQRNWLSVRILISHPHEIPHHSHQSGFHTWNEFHSALSQLSLMPSLTWLFNRSQNPQKDLLEPAHLRQHLTDWGFFLLIFFCYSLVDIQKELQETQEVMHWYHKETKSPFLFWPTLQRRLQLHHSHEVLWCWADQYTASSAPSFLADMEDHDADKLERGSQILVAQSTTGTGRVGLGMLFHSSASGVTSEGNELQSLAMTWWGKDGNSTCPNAFTLPLPKIPEMIQAKLSGEGP